MSEKTGVKETMKFIQEGFAERFGERKALQIAMFTSISHLFVEGELNAHGIEPFIRKSVANVAVKEDEDISMETFPMKWKIIGHSDGNKKEIFRWITIELDGGKEKIHIASRSIYVNLKQDPYRLTPKEQLATIRRILEYMLRDTLADIRPINWFAEKMGFNLRTRYTKISIVS